MIALLATAAAATHGSVPSFADLDRLSRAVVTGRVLSAETATAPWGLVTTFEVAVDEVLDGESGGRLRVQLPGGQQGGLTQRWSGVPDWGVGDQVLVFVPRTGVLPLTGVFTVVDGAIVDPLAREGAPLRLEDVAGLLRGPALSGR